MHLNILLLILYYVGLQRNGSQTALREACRSEYASAPSAATLEGALFTEVQPCLPTVHTVWGGTPPLDKGFLQLGQLGQSELTLRLFVQFFFWT